MEIAAKKNVRPKHIQTILFKKLISNKTFYFKAENCCDLSFEAKVELCPKTFEMNSQNLKTEKKKS